MKRLKRRNYNVSETNESLVRGQFIGAIMIKYIIWEYFLELVPKMVDSGYIVKDPNLITLAMVIIGIKIVVSNKQNP